MSRHGNHLTANTHKDRGQWFLQRATYPLRDAPPVALEKFWNNPNRFANIYGLNWTEAGPSNYPGRVTALTADPENHHKLYAGTAAGGVWFSEDAGQHWNPCWPRLLNQHIGALAMHPTAALFGDKSLLLCASGEANLSADSYCGSGTIYQSSDEGFSWWSMYGGSTSLAGPETDVFGPRRIGCIAFLPGGKSSVPGLAFGAVSSSETMPAALFIQPPDGGLTPCTFWGNRNYNCFSVVAHPTKQGLLYAAIEPRGTQNGIWRSEDFGKTWTHLTRGLPPPEACRRISLAISPSDPGILYALVGGQNSKALGVFRTSNGGETWRNVAGSEFAKEGQLSYNNCIAIHPKDPYIVLCGAIDLHLTANGGRSWTAASTGQRGSPPAPFPPNFVHSDHHAVVITPDNILYSANDGGVARSADFGKSWQSASEGMVTAMFYAFDVSQSDSNIYGGGTQDNGTLIAGVPDRRGAPPPPPGHFTRVLPGDGGWIAFDPDHAEHVFGSTSDLIFNRHKRGEPWARGPQLANWPSASIPPAHFRDGENLLRAIAVLVIGPKNGARGPRTLFAGTSRLWQSTDNGRHWRPCSPTFDGTAVSAIACSRYDSKVIFVGTSSGYIFRTKDGGETWSHNIAGPSIPRRVITSIEFHPAKRRTLVASVAATGILAADLNSFFQNTAYGHVHRSDDHGDTWTDIDKGSLPDVVFNALAFETHTPYRLFAGGDAGVWVLQQKSGWSSIAGTMPDVVVSDLHFHHKDRLLTAATYGRGIWRLKVKGPFPEVFPPEKDSADDNIAPLGFQRDPTKSAPAPLTPADAQQLTKRENVFSWTPVDGALGYVVTLNYEPGGVANFSSPTAQTTYNILSDGNWSWQVYAIFPGAWRSPGSVSRKFSCTT